MSVPISTLPPVEARTHTPTIGQRLSKLGFALLVILICAITFFPIYWMLVTTIQPTKLTLHYPPSLWPQTFDLSSYREVFDKQPVGALDSQLDPPLDHHHRHLRGAGDLWRAMRFRRCAGAAADSSRSSC